jgi:hypothetical protein
MRILAHRGTGIAGILVIEETPAATHIMVVFAHRPQKLPRTSPLTATSSSSRACSPTPSCSLRQWRASSTLGPDTWHPARPRLPPGPRSDARARRRTHHRRAPHHRDYSLSLVTISLFVHLISLSGRPGLVTFCAFLYIVTSSLLALPN